MTKLNLIKFVKACKGSGGIISVIARKLSVERSTVYDYIAREPATKKYLKDAEEEVLDIAQSHIIKGINNGDKEDIKWYLSRKGRHLGFVATDNQVNIEHNTGPTYKLIIEKIDNVRTKVETNPETSQSI